MNVKEMVAKRKKRLD